MQPFGVKTGLFDSHRIRIWLGLLGQMPHKRLFSDSEGDISVEHVSEGESAGDYQLALIADAGGGGLAAGDIVVVPAPGAQVVAVKPKKEAPKELRKHAQCGRGRHGSELERHLVCARMREGKAAKRSRLQKASHEQTKEKLLQLHPVVPKGNRWYRGISASILLDIGFNSSFSRSALALKHDVTVKWIAICRCFVAAAYLNVQLVILGCLVVRAAASCIQTMDQQMVKNCWYDSARRAKNRPHLRQLGRAPLLGTVWIVLLTLIL